MIRDAVISPCGLYRQRLYREWDAALPIFMLIGLNPSKADGSVDDPTNRRVVSFAEREGCGRVIMENLFDYRATSPLDMMNAFNPYSLDNTAAIIRSAEETAASGGKIVCAWGVHGEHQNRWVHVVGALLPKYDLLCFGTTKAGHPKHPLYLRSDTPLETFLVEWP